MAVIGQTMSLKDKLFITLTPFQNSISFTSLKHSSIFCLLQSIFNNYFKQMQKQTFEHILSQTYNASLFLFAYFFVNAHVLSKSFHSINSSFSQAKIILASVQARLKCILFQFQNIFLQDRKKYSL